MRFLVATLLPFIIACSLSGNTKETFKSRVDPLAEVLLDSMDSLAQIHQLQSKEFKINADDNKILRSTIIGNTVKEQLPKIQLIN